MKNSLLLQFSTCCLHIRRFCVCFLFSTDVIMTFSLPYIQDLITLSIVNITFLRAKAAFHMFLAYCVDFFVCCCCCFGCWVAKSCPTLWDPMDCSTQGSSVVHYVPECAQILVHWAGDAIQPSHFLLLPSPFESLQSFPASGSFPMSQLLEETPWKGCQECVMLTQLK